MSEPAPVFIRPARPTDAARLAHIHVTSWRETYTGLMPPGVLERMTSEAMQLRREQGWLHTLSQETDCVQVAELSGQAPDGGPFCSRSGQVVGFASGGALRPHTVIPGDYDAELYTLYALREAQGRGLGRLLFAAVARELHGRGFVGLALWVLAANPTRQFYAHLGGRELGHRTEAVPGGELSEVALGWRDLTRLL